MRILVVRLSSLGDVVHTIPVVAALRRTFPNARIDWLIDERYLELAELVSVVDHRIPVPRRLGASWLSSAVRALRDTRYDVAVDLQGLIKSAVLARASGAKRVIGFAQGQLREPAARWFYTETPSVSNPTHVIDKNLALVANLDVSAQPLEFPIADTPSGAVERTRDALGNGPNERFALLNPGAAWSSKCWDPLKFGELAARLGKELGLRSAVSWGPDERGRAERVVAASDGSAVLTPSTTIPDVVALARAASVMVSGDTGPLHIGAAVGTPIVGVFGPSDPDRNGPWSASDVAVSRFRECPCQQDRSHLRGVIVRRCVQRRSCMATISVDEVVRAVSHRLGLASDA